MFKYQEFGNLPYLTEWPYAAGAAIDNPVPPVRFF
jgi:hypothetical protein